MKHPPHAADRCCRVCHAINLTDEEARRATYVDAPVERAEARRKSIQEAKLAALVKQYLPGTGPDWRHAHYDRARTRTGAGLQQLNESTGDRDG